MASRKLFSCVLLCLLDFILEVTDGLSLPKSPRTCVIGAGYSGLGVARYLKEYGVDFTVFEASRDIGGIWRFDPHVGTDEDGIPPYTSIYKNLRTISPRQTMEYSGFPFPDGTPSYPEGTCFHKYLKAFAKKYDILDNIQLRSMITSVKWARDHWELTYKKRVDTKDSRTEACDFVVVASGEYLNPRWPEIEGMDAFRGKMIHSQDYKETTPFHGRRVLLVGAGASGLDLAKQLSNVTTKLVHSHHLKYNQPHFSDSYVKKPDIKAFTATGVVFEDDSFEEVDDVIFCTGYSLNHHFLDENCGVTATDRFVLPLYKQMINIKHPSMAFIGVAKKIICKVLDAQGQYIASLVAGKFQLPSQEEMLRDWLDHVHLQQKHHYKIRDVNVVGPETLDKYFGNLTAEAGVPSVPPVIIKMRDFNLVNRLEDLLHYRDYDWAVIDDHNYSRTYQPRKKLPCPVPEY